MAELIYVIGMGLLAGSLFLVGLGLLINLARWWRDDQ
jgi:hypothetical protein